MKNETVDHHLKTIRIEDLFGRYTYSLPSTTQALGDINIIYGENGVGKTTLLNLVFHMLSPANNKGHRTRIAETPFSRLIITLSDGTCLSAKKDPQLLVGPVDFDIQTPNERKVSWRFEPDSDSSSIKAEDLPKNLDVSRLPKELRARVDHALEEQKFFEAHKKVNISVYMLTSDRMLLGDSVREPNKVFARSENVRSRAKLSDILLEHRIASVTEALEGSSSWLQRKFYDRAYAPTGLVSNPYQEVIRKIAKTTYRTSKGLNQSQETKIVSGLTQAIADLEKRTGEFAKFGLVTSPVPQDVLSILNACSGNRLHLINSILEPHLGSLKARADSIQPLYELLDNFVSHVNKFLKDKRVVYTMRTGFQIRIGSAGDGLSNDNTGDEITPSQLSSGEQQLILLFCHVLTTRDTPSIFIIDEPEISLNILWQRLLVSSLMDVGKNSSLQLVLASHSMEILSKHRARVVTMEEE